MIRTETVKLMATVTMATHMAECIPMATTMEADTTMASVIRVCSMPGLICTYRIFFFNVSLSATSCLVENLKLKRSFQT